MASWTARRRRALSGLVRVLAALGVTALFGAGFTLGVIGHLNLPAGKRATGTLLDRTLADLFQGRISIGQLSQVSPSELEATDIVVRDPQGRSVLKVTRLTARANLLGILASIARGDSKLTIVIDYVRVERAEAQLIPAEDGLPSIAHAFSLRETTATTPSGAPRYVRVWLPAIELGQGFARGRVGTSPTAEAEVSGAHGSVLVSPKGAAVDVARFSLLVRGLAGADARGVAALHVRAPGPVFGSFDGYIGDLQFGSVARYDQAGLDARLDLPRAEPAATRALLPSWPLIESVQAKLSLKGQPPSFDVDLQAQVGERSALSGSGQLDIATPAHLELDLQGQRLDLRTLWPKAPSTSIDVTTKLALRDLEHEPQVELRGSVAPTTIERIAIPALDFSGATSQRTFLGQAKLHDRGLPMDLGFSVFPDGKIELQAEAKRVELSSVDRLKPYFDGRGSADLRLHAALDHGRLDTHLTLDVRDLAYRGVGLANGRISAGASGSLDKPEQLSLDARLTGKGLSAGRFSFEDVSASARGPLRSPTVTTSLKDSKGPSFDARADVGLGSSVSLRKVSAGVSRDGVEIRGDVTSVDWNAERVVLRGLLLHGASGELRGDAELSPRLVSLQAQGKDLDLSAFSRVLGLPRGSLEGRASLRLDARVAGKTEQGSLDLTLAKGAILGLSDISGQLSANLDGHRLRGAASGRIEALGAFSSDFDTVLAGPATTRAAFERAVGHVSLALDDLTLDYLGQLLPDQELDVSGRAAARLELSRTDPEVVPNLRLSASTQGLSLRRTTPGQPPVVVSGIELSLSASHDGATGSTSLALGAERGSERLLTVSADTALDPKAALSGRAPLLSQLKTQPLVGKLVVSRLDLNELPPPLRVAGISGTLRVEGTVRGSLVSPVAALAVRASELRLGGDRSQAVDVCGTAEYREQGGAFNVSGEVFLPAALGLPQTPCSGRRVANMQVNGTAPYEPGRGVPEANYTAQASLDGLPLDTVPELAAARVSGSASGTLFLDRSRRDPAGSAQLHLADVKVDRLSVGNGSLKVRSDAKRAHLDFEIERDKTAVNGNLDAGLAWSGQLPALAADQPIDVALEARQLEASVLEPLLSDFVSDLHGSVTGEVNARLDALAAGDASRRISRVDGKVALLDGSLVLSGLGFRLRDVDFSAVATRTGKATEVRVENFRASAGAKLQNLSARIILLLEGLEIASGSASVNVEGLPLVVDGITRANANISISQLALRRDADHVMVDVPFERLEIKLPDASSRELISLDDSRDVTILQPIAQPRAARNDAGLPWQFAIHLGKNARVQRGAQLDVPITGNPNVVLASGVGVTGAIMLDRRGVVQLADKLFQIEGGAIVFDTPDPTDPRLDVRASWRSPDDQTVYMYVIGTLSKPKVLFDRPQQDALAMLGSSTAGTTGIGLSVLDTLLAGTPLGRVQLSGKESEDGTRGATYTAAYRASDRVIVEGNYQAASSTNPEEAGTVGAAVDYRMTKTISVRAQLGTIGTGVDLVYQYRY